MKQRTISRILMTAGAVAAIAVLLVFGLFVPLFANECRIMYPELSRLYWPGLIGMWTIGFIYLMCLAEYFRVCVRIGADQSFCPKNVKCLRRIAVYMACSGVLWILSAVAPGLVFQADVGPLWIYFVLFSMAGFALAMLAWGMSLLLHRAAALQEESDLTV